MSPFAAVAPVRQASSPVRDNFVEIMEMLDKRLNDKGKNWRHVFKVRGSLAASRCTSR